MPRTVPSKLDRTTRSAGFTLIEILVTISIIAILAAISIPAMNALYQRAAESQTKVLLKQLDSVTAEYEAQTGQKAFTTTGSSPEVPDYGYSDGSGTATDSYSVEKLHEDRIAQLQPALDMLNTINEDFIVRETPSAKFDFVRDGWERPVRFFPGTLAFEDRGFAIPNAAALEDKGMPRRRGAYFASAGQDGLWGTIDPATDLPDDNAEDNLYSFEAD